MARWNCAPGVHLHVALDPAGARLAELAHAQAHVEDQGVEEAGPGPAASLLAARSGGC